MPISSIFINGETFSPENNQFLAAAGLFFAAIFIVGTANYYNFMDGINGIAGITGAVWFGLLTWYGTSLEKDYNYLMLSAGMSISCLGFLPFNIPKAKVFMGDVGSILLGFLFSVLIIMFSESILQFIVFTSFLFPFYADELATVAERIIIRQRLTDPHRLHLYQVLVNEAGIAHWKVSLGYGALQLLVGVCSWQIAEFGLNATAGWLTVMGIIFLWLNNRVKKRFCRINN